MRLRSLALLVLAVLSAPCRAGAEGDDSEALLFVGNSLTYVGNLPAVYATLAEAGGCPTNSDMIVRAGATLDQRLADGSVAEALEGHRFSTVVLQERGGDLLCAFGPDSCAQSRAAINALAELAREQGAAVVLLGSFQSEPWATSLLVEAEAKVASEADVIHVEVSRTLERLRQALPEMRWFADDGMHPGRDLTLLKALLLHRALHGGFPSPAALEVQAPIYDSTAGLSEALRSADATPPLADTPLHIGYSAETVQALIDALDDGPEAACPGPAQ